MKIEGYSAEERPCSECLQYKVVIGEIPICKKKLMTVCGGLYVTYKNDEGTCFEPK